MTPTATPLEVYVDAAASSLLAYAYPSDIQIRAGAMQAARLANVDYIEALGTILDHNRNMRPDVARLHLALHFIEHVRHEAETGAEPREGILSSGKPADELGRDPDHTED